MNYLRCWSSSHIERTLGIIAGKNDNIGMSGLSPKSTVIQGGRFARLSDYGTNKGFRWDGAIKNNDGTKGRWVYDYDIQDISLIDIDLDNLNNSILSLPNTMSCSFYGGESNKYGNSAYMSDFGITLEYLTKGFKYGMIISTAAGNHIQHSGQLLPNGKWWGKKYDKVEYYKGTNDNIRTEYLQPIWASVVEDFIFPNEYETCNSQSYNKDFNVIESDNLVFIPWHNFSTYNDKFPDKNETYYNWTMKKYLSFMDLVVPGSRNISISFDIDLDNVYFDKGAGTSYAPCYVSSIISLMLSVDKTLGLELNNDDRYDLVRKAYNIITFTAKKVLDNNDKPDYIADSFQPQTTFDICYFNTNYEI